MRVNITLECTECGDRNYITTKNKRENPERIELKKYCPRLRRVTLHAKLSKQQDLHSVAFFIRQKGEVKMEDKRLIREKILRNLNSIDKVEHRERSIKLAEKLFLLPEWENAKVVGITLARHPESKQKQSFCKRKKKGRLF